jgi:hypothetical protein
MKSYSKNQQEVSDGRLTYSESSLYSLPGVRRTSKKNLPPYDFLLKQQRRAIWLIETKEKSI